MSEIELLINTLSSLLDSDNQAKARLKNALDKVQADTSQKNIFLQFALCARGVSQESAVSSSAIQNDEARERLKNNLAKIAPYGLLERWSAFRLSRLLFLLELSRIIDEAAFADCINQLFSTADVNEQILLVQGLNFFPRPERFVERAREAARSNIVSVFSAVAHKSDYARRYFDHEGWNQLILKAAFLAVPIHSIVGLSDRNNDELVKMLKHYVWERQAASRDLPWDIWACIGWRAETAEDLAYLEQQAEKLDDVSRAAIVLSLLENARFEARAKALQEKYCSQVKVLSWKGLAQLKETQAE